MPIPRSGGTPKRQPEPQLEDEILELPDFGEEEPAASQEHEESFEDSSDEATFETVEEWEVEDEDDSAEDEADEEEDEPSSDDEEEPQPAKRKRPFASLRSSTGKKKAKKEKKPAGDLEFIDKKNNKLKPFGGPKSKLKVSDLDPRRNLRRQTKTVWFVTIALVLAGTVAGWYQVIVPQPTLSEQDVQSIVAVSSGEIGYPTERAGGFAQDFVTTFLDVNNTADSEKALAQFYSGTESTQDLDTRVTNSDYKQSVVFGPTIYESQALTPYSGRFTVGAMVRPGVVKGEAADTTARWVYFNVNVYYDAETDSFTIPNGSPTMIPAPSTGQRSNLPQEDELGDQVDTELKQLAAPTIVGFVKAYAISTPENYISLDQYLVSNPDPSLLTGMGDKFELVGADTGDIDYTIYDPGTEGATLKVETNLTWRLQSGEGESNARIDYNSKYIITLERQSNGKYLVSKMAPKYFVEREE